MDEDHTVQQRLPSLRPPIGFAHRGARAHAPENTIEAFTLARTLGATGVESDVWLTADGICVLDHDGVVRRGLRKVPIGEIARDDLPEHIPTLAALLAVLGPDVDLSLDLKDDDAGPAVIEVARDVLGEAWLDRLWLCHPDWQHVAALRAQSDTVHLVDSTRLSRMKDGPERRAAQLAEVGVDAVNLHYSDWTGGLATLFHRFGRYCLGWDLQHERLLRDAIRMGLDGIFSDWVDRMVDAMRVEGVLA